MLSNLEGIGVGLSATRGPWLGLDGGIAVCRGDLRAGGAVRSQLL